jgi:hypothetical protein
MGRICPQRTDGPRESLEDWVPLEAVRAKDSTRGALVKLHWLPMRELHAEMNKGFRRT